jgi:ribosomal protein S18 acetylase RimI-like enzyme
MPCMEIRTLTSDDVPEFREVRLRALRDHPDAFASDAEKFEQTPLADIRSRLSGEGQHPDNFTLGAYIGGRLVGMVGLVREQNTKLKHKAFIWGVYVAPEARGSGVARALMQEAINRARRLDGLEMLYLGVRSDNTPARSLYLSLGFEVYGTEPHSIKLPDRYVDEDLMLLWLGSAA